MNTKTKTKTQIPSVNFHLWEPCNFSCKYCFATFQDVRKTILPKGHLSKEDALELVNKLANAGFSKITFAGGEPTLCPWIEDLIINAKAKGLVTMIVTNGTRINENFLSKVDGNLDWVVFSIDSITPQINKEIGRYQGLKIIPNQNFYFEKIQQVRRHGIKLKINSVINKKNINDKGLVEFISLLQPERWKLFAPLRIIGQNDVYFDEVNVSQAEFENYLMLNEVHKLSFAVTEDNIAMTGSYIMIDPAGRFFDNTKGTHTYSKPILHVGVNTALEEISYDYDQFLERGGLYEF